MGKSKIKHLVACAFIVILSAIFIYYCWNSYTVQREQYLINQESLYEEIQYSKANKQLKADKTKFGVNFKLSPYEGAVAQLHELDLQYKRGESLSVVEIEEAKRSVTEKRNAYLDAADSIEQRKEKVIEERAKQRQNELKQRQKELSEAEESYVDPEILTRDYIDENTLTELINLSTEDLKYVENDGWYAYSEQAIVVQNRYTAYRDAILTDGDTDAALREFNEAIEKLRKLRRYMVIAEAVGDWYLDGKEEYESFKSDETGAPKDPYVYVTESGTKYHLTGNCRGLENAKETFVITESEAKSKGYTMCRICCGL